MVRRYKKRSKVLFIVIISVLLVGLAIFLFSLQQSVFNTSTYQAGPWLGEFDGHDIVINLNANIPASTPYTDIISAVGFETPETLPLNNMADCVFLEGNWDDGRNLCFVTPSMYGKFDNIAGNVSCFRDGDSKTFAAKLSISDGNIVIDPETQLARLPNNYASTSSCNGIVKINITPREVSKTSNPDTSIIIPETSRPVTSPTPSQSVSELPSTSKAPTLYLIGGLVAFLGLIIGLVIYLRRK